MPASPRIRPLDRRHQRPEFRCGHEPLDRYLATLAGQEMRRRISVTYVLSGARPDEVAGYYSLAATSVGVHDLPTSVVKSLPRYPLIPATLLGRLAVATAYQRQGLGELLLLDALRRSFDTSAVIGAMAVIAHAKDDAAVQFYRRYDFQPFPDAPRHLFLPMATSGSLFGAGSSA